jgi:hypothetical protein
LTASSGDLTFAVHSMNLNTDKDMNCVNMTLERIKLLEKPTMIQAGDLQRTHNVYLCDVSNDIS